MRDNVCVFFTATALGGRGKPQGRFRRLLVPYSPLAANCARSQLKAQLLTAGYTAGCKFRVVLQLLVTSAPRRASCGARRAQIPH